jgi:hypothetical protein
VPVISPTRHRTCLIILNYSLGNSYKFKRLFRASKAERSSCRFFCCFCRFRHRGIRRGAVSPANIGPAVRLTGENLLDREKQRLLPGRSGAKKVTGSPELIRLRSRRGESSRCEEGQNFDRREADGPSQSSSPRPKPVRFSAHN